MTAYLDAISNRAVPGRLTNTRPSVTAPENETSGFQDSGPSSTLSRVVSRRPAANASITAAITKPAMIIATTSQACPLRDPNGLVDRERPCPRSIVTANAAQAEAGR
jgi:hypothetical protein